MTFGVLIVSEDISDGSSRDVARSIRQVAFATKDRSDVCRQHRYYRMQQVLPRQSGSGAAIPRASDTPGLSDRLQSVIVISREVKVPPVASAVKPGRL